VVLLHSIARTSRSLTRLERALRAAGFATLNIDYPSRRKPIAALADEIHPAIARFSEAHDAPLHFVAHSMGGLLVRAYVAKYRPARLARVVTLGTPHGGSEVADLLKGSSLYRMFYGPAGLELTTEQADRSGSLPAPDYPVGTIAGSRFIDPVAGLFVLPKPNDGRVSVQSAMVEGMTDHVIVRASHTGLPRHTIAIAQTIAFLREGRFQPL
jgi:pimeloyl-ACP methyl ester carboxylesterase